MKNKKYFDKGTTGILFSCIILGIILLISKMARYILELFDLIEQRSNSSWSSDTGINTVIYILIIYSIYRIYRFMRNANRGFLFSIRSHKDWINVSNIFIVIGTICGIYSIYNLNYIGGVPVCGIIASIAYSFSKIFKEGTQLKNENDLTI